MKYKIITYGCQANERDSETHAGMLDKMGYQPAANLEEADVILFNTCCVREKAEHKVFSKIGELKELKSRNPQLIIAVGGCMVQQEGMPQLIRRRAPYVDLIIGTHNIHELPQMIENIHLLNSPQVHVLEDRKDVIEGLPAQRTHDFKALVNITYGCNNFCTYCIVPYVRGREKSREVKHILAEIKELAQDGVIEVMLLGQNVNSYGKDLDPVLTFAQLLKEISRVEGIRRIRYMTSHPKDLSAELIKTIAETEKVCQHFHLPVQAGSTKVLQRMNRGYTREDYLALIKKIRSTFPNAAITTDIIVGFPGETEEDFAQTLDLVAECRFDSAYTFLYSPRSGTPASKMEDQVPTAVKKERLQRLMSMQNKISKEINEKLGGEIVEVLVEERSVDGQGLLMGRTATNKSVLFQGEDSLVRTLVKVEITKPQTWVLKGKLAE